MESERFTIKAQEAIQIAQETATKFNHGELRNIHILFALLNQSDTLIPALLREIGVNSQKLKEETERELSLLPKIYSSTSLAQLYLSSETLKLFSAAKNLADKFKDEFISCEHLFAALLDTPSSAQSILLSYSISHEKIFKALALLRGSTRVTDDNPETKYQVLKKYAVNLCQKARQGKLDPVIDREKELERVIQILCRRIKNNPVLVGEPGVGKTAIVEGLAQKIVSGDIPEILKGKEIISMDMGALIAGTKFRGEFENRLKTFISEIKNSQGKYILFIDEIHTLIGAGAAEGAIDASNLLKPALSRGEIKIIGATTTQDYRHYIEKDAALERRFQPVIVEEPSLEDSITIIRGIKEKYEIHHGIRILDEAVVAAVNLSARYITDRFLPDKAIDLIDEAASARQIEGSTVPRELDDIRKKITRLEIEKSALSKEKKKNKRLEDIKKELNSLKEKNDELSAKWHAEKITLSDFHNLRKKVENLQREAEMAEREGNLERVAQIRYGELPQAQKEVKLFEKKYVGSRQEKFIKEYIDSEDIAAIVSKWTGIPVEKMLQSEIEKLSHIEEVLSGEVVGQEQAIKAVANALRRARAGLAEETRPLASFMFLGPTGVGKTQLAKSLAKFIFNDEKAMIRVDMSEYMEKFSVSRLIGSPPGYVGYEEGGQLTDKVRHRPYSLILFDEIEKAHPEIFNILLQLLDEGRLTDGKGKVVNFRNCIIIMTSNIGSEYFKKVSKIGFETGELESEKNYKGKVNELLKEHFRPEFLNRLDEIIVFNPLGKAEIKKIVDIQLEQLTERLKKKGIKAHFDKSLKNYLAENGFDPEYGARPLKRLIQKVILNPLAEKVIKQEVYEGKRLTLSYKNNQLKVNS